MDEHKLQRSVDSLIRDLAAKRAATGGKADYHRNRGNEHAAERAEGKAEGLHMAMHAVKEYLGPLLPAPSG